VPFSIQRQFLEKSPQIQQAIGKLKIALELEAHEIDSLCVSLQKLILKTRIPDSIRNEIDRMIIKKLAGVTTFVVRSSSNAEDLESFSAAGIYESVN
jgi:phosphoenolpyruvate synthase/pyruvate phosphate dikinase